MAHLYLLLDLFIYGLIVLANFYFMTHSVEEVRNWRRSSFLSENMKFFILFLLPLYREKWPEVKLSFLYLMCVCYT